MASKPDSNLTADKIVILLSSLLSLFVFRVFAQLIQYNRNLAFLPGFDTWHSATIPYGWLLVSQLFIIFIILAVIFKIHFETYQCNKRRALILLCLGIIYFLFMTIRFALSLTILQSHPWFGATLPAFFHIVLAAIVIVIGIYDFQGVDS
jgi:hypothetical protein